MNRGKIRLRILKRRFLRQSFLLYLKNPSQWEAALVKIMEHRAQTNSKYERALGLAAASASATQPADPGSVQPLSMQARDQSNPIACAGAAFELYHPST